MRDLIHFSLWRATSSAADCFCLDADLFVAQRNGQQLELPSLTFAAAETESGDILVDERFEVGS